MGRQACFDEKQGMVFDYLFLETKKTNAECHTFEIDRIKDVEEPYDLFP